MTAYSLSTQPIDATHTDFNTHTRLFRSEPAKVIIVVTPKHGDITADDLITTSSPTEDADHV
jgi:hypothetical protein